MSHGIHGQFVKKKSCEYYVTSCICNLSYIGTLISDVLYMYIKLFCYLYLKYCTNDCRFPALRLSPEVVSHNLHPGISSALDSRMSSYDNVEGRNHQNHCASQISDNDDTQTVFSEPWDSSRWESLLRPVGDDSAVQVAGATPLLGPEEDDTVYETNVTANGNHVSRSKSFKERLDPLLCKYFIIIVIHKFIISVASFINFLVVRLPAFHWIFISGSG